MEGGVPPAGRGGRGEALRALLAQKQVTATCSVSILLPLIATFKARFPEFRGFT